MKKIVILLIFVGFFLSKGFSQAQITDEQAEKIASVLKLLQHVPSYKLETYFTINSGYESNPTLSNKRKGDWFEEFLTTVAFKKPQGKYTFFAYYDFDLMNYHEFTDLTNYLNHLRVGVERKLAKKFKAGLGLDYSYLWYPHYRSGNFSFLKEIAYLRCNLAKNFYYELGYEHGVKNYQHKKSLADTIGTYQDKERRDERNSARLSFGFKPNKRLFLSFNNYYIFNDSNARYVDFYDYKAYRSSLNCYCRLSSRWKLVSSFIYQIKNYTSRTVTLRDYTQRDKFYSGTLEAVYQFSRRLNFYAYYTYRQNSSNDHYEEYLDSIIGAGLRFKF